MSLDWLDSLWRSSWEIAKERNQENLVKRYVPLSRLNHPNRNICAIVLAPLKHRSGPTCGTSTKSTLTINL